MSSASTSEGRRVRFDHAGMLAEAVYQDRSGLRRLFAEFGQEFTIGVTAPPPKADMMIAQDDWHKRTRLKSAFV
jgi:hypothetical protein